MSSLVQEIVKLLPDLTVSIIVLGLTWFVGQRLTVYWNLRQKRKELQISTAHEFQALYGEFFAVWKLWNYYIRDIGPGYFPEISRWDLLERASNAEARMESVFVQLATERFLSPQEIEILARFRQAYQSLRETIRDNVALPWESSTQIEYVTFKSLATKVALIILSEENMDQSRADKRVDALLDITTSSRWEGSWVIRDKPSTSSSSKNPEKDS